MLQQDLLNTINKMRKSKGLESVQLKSTEQKISERNQLFADREAKRIAVELERKSKSEKQTFVKILEGEQYAFTKGNQTKLIWFKDEYKGDSKVCECIYEDGECVKRDWGFSRNADESTNRKAKNLLENGWEYVGKFEHFKDSLVDTFKITDENKLKIVRFSGDTIYVSTEKLTDAAASSATIDWLNDTYMNKSNSVPPMNFVGMLDDIVLAVNSK